MQVEASIKETVIVVHGTWAAPGPGISRWYQPADGDSPAGIFVTKLDDALNKRGSAARCWAHCAGGFPIFHWSGENDWVARTTAVSALRDYVNGLQKQGWRCHIVAHSRGGGVVAEAFSNQSEAIGGQAGKIVTLGTPFLDTMSAIAKRTERRGKNAEIVSWIAIAILFSYFTFVMLMAVSDFAGGPAMFPFYDYVHFPSTLAYLLTLAGLVWLIVRRIRQRALTRFQVDQAHSEAPAPTFLAIGSLMDEPWQILHHVRSLENPLSIRSNLLIYLFSALRASISNSSKIARIQGAKSYRDFGIGNRIALLSAHLSSVLTVIAAALLITKIYSWPRSAGLGEAAELALALAAFLVCVIVLLILIATFTNRLGLDFSSAYWSPFRWFIQRAASIGSIFTALASYYVPRKAWILLQTLAIGLEGYRYALPDVEQTPSYFATGVVKYENMPAAAEQRAITRRSAWIGLHLGDVPQTFARLAVTAADITSLLRIVAADQSLVHGAYYTDDDCIARIADWIADWG